MDIMSSNLPSMYDDDQSPSSDEGHSPKPFKRKRKRAALSCAECRRLKTKCDRQVPCSGCLRRGCADLCPNGSSGSVRNLLNERQRLEARVRELEARATSRDPVVHPSRPPHDLSYSNPPSSSSEAFRQTPHGYPFHLSPSSEVSPSTVQSQPPPPPRAHHEHLGTYGLPWQSSRTSATYSAVREQDLDDESGQRRYLPFDNSGTLVVTASGRSKFLGPGAASQQLREGANENLRSRFPSPASSPPPDLRGTLPVHPMLLGYPARARPDTASYKEARDNLPPEEEVRVLIDCYFRYVAWNTTPILKVEMDRILESVYHSTPPDPEALTLEYQKLALLYIVMAFGTMMNMEHPPNDPMAEKYFLVAQQCLFNGRFLVYNTLVGLQSLTIMAKFLSYTDSPGRHDLSWQLWGMGMRIAISMGLHRDGEQWNLSDAELNQRRRVYWETYNLDVWRSFSFDRPPAISPQHFDTKLPTDLESGPNGEPGWFSVKFQMTRIAYDVLDESLRVVTSSFPRLTDLWDRFCALEAEVPFYLRCRASMKAMVSKYPTMEAAEEASPAPSRTDFKTTFRPLQQHALALNLTGTVFTLLRPYFVQALHRYPEDPTRSPYAKAYLAVIERSSMMVSILKSIHTLFPWASTRHWFFWADIFSAAICMATVCLVSPDNPLVGLCLSDLNDVIAMYESIRDAYPGGALRENLKCLKYLVKQYYERSPSTDPIQAYLHMGYPIRDESQDARDKNDHMDLVGWKTRLIELSEGRVVARPREHSGSKSANGGTNEKVPSGKAPEGIVPVPPGPAMDLGEVMHDEPPTHDMTSIMLQQLLEAPLGQGPPQSYGLDDTLSLGFFNDELRAPDQADPFYDFGLA